MAATFFLDNAKAGNGPPGMLADPIDLATGELLSISRTYDPTDAAVLTALRTVRGSGSAVEDVGQRFHDHPRVDSKLPSFLEQEVAFALRHLTESKQVETLEVSVEAYDDAAELVVRYTNLAQRQRREARARLSELVR